MRLWDNLQAAKVGCKDEFYTRYQDVADEVEHYSFRDKVVLCNCDVPESAFVRYFADNFGRLGLKKLLACGLNREGEGVGYEMDGQVASTFPLPSYLGFDSFGGDEMLAKADVVVTNPPFSLFRHWMKKVLAFDKDFIVLGNINAVGYVDISKAIMDGRVWVGANFNVDLKFTVPDDYSCTHVEDGVRLARVATCGWYTSLPHTSNRLVELVEKYEEGKYRRYDNFDAIEVPKTLLIPYDYDGLMGVPITAINRLDWDEFELFWIWGNNAGGEEVGIRRVRTANGKMCSGPVLDGKALFKRLLIRRKRGI